MANWWDAAPLAEQPKAGGNWWDNAPLAQDAAPARAPDGPQPDGPTRITVRPQDAKLPSGPDRGAIDATARGAAQGLTANFSDEMRGLVEAAGANPDEPASLSRLLTGALKYWGGDADAKKRYDEAVKRERDVNKQSDDQHPVASTIGNLTGALTSALALPVGVAAQGTTLPARMGLGAATGAGMGAAYGVGEGEGAADSIARGASGMALGGAIGGVAPAVIEGAVRGARAVAQPVAAAIRGIRDPEGEAARRVAVAIERDMRADPTAATRMTPAEFAASSQSGGPAMVMDLGGETARAVARSAANTSPEGREVLNRSINDRYEGQTQRVTDWLRRTFHFPDAVAQQDALEQAARGVNRQRYAQAYRDGSGPLWDDTLQTLTSSPDVQAAIRNSTRTGANEAAINGGRAPPNPFVFAEDGSMSLRPGVHPTLQFWDHVQRNLNSDIGKAQRSGDRESVRQLTMLRNALNNHLDQAVPSFREARAGAAHFFGAQDALEAGQNFVKRNMSSADARRAIAQMSPQERQLFQDGFISKFVDDLNQVGDRRSILNKIAESPAAREKLNLVLGRQRAEELEAGLRVEGIMDFARRAVQGNSTTARQLAELGLAGGVYGIGTGGDLTSPNPTALMHAALVYGAARGKGRIDSNVAHRVAELLTSNDPQRLVRGLQLLQRSQQMFNSLRAFDRGVVRIGADQAPTSGALSLAGVGRADKKDQPEIPRPPGQ